MLNDILLSFFFGMPAFVMLIQSPKLQNPVARIIMMLGSTAASLIVALVALGLIGCDGTMMSGYTNCAGGRRIEALFNALQPVLKAGTFLYIMAGIPLACLAYGLEWVHTRKQNTKAS